MIAIDGSHGGGQLLRTALSLSAVTRKPFTITNVRGKRTESGLKHQHLTAVHATQKMCDAHVTGDSLGSTELTFIPAQIRGGKYLFDIGTAGSTTLLLQTLIPVSLYADQPSTLTVKGGTDNPLAPGSFYFQHIFCHFLRRLGLEFNFTLQRHGFYPQGGGMVNLAIAPHQHLRDIHFVERGSLVKIDVHSVATTDLQARNVVERCIIGFRQAWKENKQPQFHEYCIEADNTGCFVHAHAHYEHYKVGTDVLGEPGKTAEHLGKHCAQQLNALMAQQGVDAYAADQLMIYLALKGRGSILASTIDEHVHTNVAVIEKFLDAKFKIKNNLITCGPVV